MLDEQCNQYQECGAFSVYTRAGKPVLDAEYRASLYPGFCAADRRAGIMGAAVRARRSTARRFRSVSPPLAM